MTQKKILITGVTPFARNRGLAAIFRGDLNLLKTYFPSDNILVEPLGYYSPTKYQASFYIKNYEKDNNIHILKRVCTKEAYFGKFFIRSFLLVVWNILKYIGIDITKILYLDKTLKTYLQSDIVLSANGGDGFTDIYSSSIGKITGLSFYPYLTLSLLNKPHIFLPQTITPFKSQLIKHIAKFILNKSTLIMVREKETAKYLETIGIDEKKIFLIPDMAFVMEPCDLEITNKILRAEGIKENQKIIGIALRDIIKDGNLNEITYKKYITVMGKLIDYLIECFDVAVLLIPHSGIKYSKRINNDVLSKIKNNDKIYLLNRREYATEELKGIIGRCELFIGTYMHSNIASLSMSVPTIGLGYSYKFKGIFEMLGQEKYVCNLKDLTYDDLISKVEDAWNKRERIKKELEKRNVDVKKKILFAGELVKKVLDEQESK